MPSMPSMVNPSVSSASSAPPPAVLERQGEYHVLRLGPREYRVGGLEKNNSLEVLKVAVRLRHGDDFHLDSFDMARDGDRRRFIERAAEETRLEKELIKRDLGKLLLALEQEQAERINAALAPAGGPRMPEMSAEDRAEALALLKSPDLVAKLGDAFEACGLVGEATNRLAAYLACTSRKLERPLAIIIQSTSAAGKSALMEAVLAMFPEEDRIKYSAMTGQSLYYLGEANLKHKILAIVEEEGAEKATYALKLLQSEGERFDYVRVTLEDIALANRLAPELLGRSLDELPPQTRRLLIQIKAAVRERMKGRQVEQPNALFNRRELRHLSGWSEHQVRVHLNKLESLEYVARRWGRQGQGWRAVGMRLNIQQMTPPVPRHARPPDGGHGHLPDPNAGRYPSGSDGHATQRTVPHASGYAGRSTPPAARGAIAHPTPYRGQPCKERLAGNQCGNDPARL